MPERTAALLLFGRSAVVFVAGDRGWPRRRGFSCGKAAAGERLRAAARARELVRVEACGAHACLPKLRASAAGGFGPPHLRATRIQAAACGGTQHAGLRQGEAAAPPIPRGIEDVATGPQPSGGACDERAKCSPPPRGRLRAAALKREHARVEACGATVSTDAGLKRAEPTIPSNKKDRSRTAVPVIRISLPVRPGGPCAVWRPGRP